MGRWIRVSVDGASSLAPLSEDASPKACDALWDSLPLEAPLTHTKWSGAAATFVAPSGPLAARAENEEGVCSLYPGVLAIRPGGEALLSYGDAECRDELGVQYATRLARLADGGALMDRLHAMYDRGDTRIRLERAEAPRGAVAATGRRLEVDVDGAKAVYRLLDDRAPRTCALLWDMLPIETTTFYSRWAGDAGVVETKPDRVADLLAGELEAPATSMYAGTLCCGPTPRWMDVYLAFGGAECRGATGRRYVTVTAEVEGDPSALFALLRRTRREGEKRVVIRRLP